MERSAIVAAGKRKRKTADTSNTRKKQSSTVPEFALYPLDLPLSLLDAKNVFEGINLAAALNPLCECSYQAIRTTVSKLLAREITLIDVAAVKAIAQDMLVIKWVQSLYRNDGSTIELKTAAGLADSIQTLEPVLTIAFSDTAMFKKSMSKGASAKMNKLAVERRSMDFYTRLMSFWQKAKLLETDIELFLNQAKSTALPCNPYIQTSLINEPSACISTLNVHDPSKNVSSSDIPTAADIVSSIKYTPFYRDQIGSTHHHVTAIREAKYGKLPKAIEQSKTWQSIQSFTKIYHCYEHQTEALHAIQDGHSVILSASTSSGKSLVYQLAILYELERIPHSRSILIFPTKALAQDQKRSLNNLICQLPHLTHSVCDTFDGDTSTNSNIRKNLRNTLSIALTNPDMLHAAILPHHALWHSFLMNLRFVVIDEMHYYTGKLGVHFALVMRRLLRICRFYGNNHVQFIGCSATIGNPFELMKTLVGVEDVIAVTNDTSGMGARHQIIWNPPYRFIDFPSLGRLSVLDETAQVFAFCILKQVKTICFTKTRNLCELVFRETVAVIQKTNPELSKKIASYRGGYNSSDRRRIESQLFCGELLGIVSTNALELGIDIGVLDVVIHCGFPFSFASYHQQLGRAGRRGKHSLSILIAEDTNSGDQCMVKNPSYLFETTSFENVIVDISNQELLEPHLQCASAEIPFNPMQDAALFVSPNEDATLEDTINRLEYMCDQHLRFDVVQNAYICASKYQGNPSSDISIRGMLLANADSNAFVVMDISTRTVIESIEPEKVAFTLYPDAVFLHMGNVYLIVDVNINQKLARAKRAFPCIEYITKCKSLTRIDPVSTRGSKSVQTQLKKSTGLDSIQCRAGKMELETTVFGYLKLNPKTMAVLEYVDTNQTTSYNRIISGIWIDIPLSTVLAIQQKNHDIEFSIHAATHILKSILPLYTSTNTDSMHSIAHECKSPNVKQSRSPRIILYDSSGQMGLVERMIRFMPYLILKAAHSLSKCECLDGCESCVWSTSCRYGNQAIDKHGALKILNDLAGVDTDPLAL
ncbi:hypothetical protein BDV3_007062 [Batrachochytrium dendrobatidis]